MHPDFNPHPRLQDASLTLRPLMAADFEPLYAVARDPDIWSGHPAKDRYQRPVFEAYFETLLNSGGTLLCSLSAENRVVGCSRYYTAPLDPRGISIGYTFLGREWWGGQINFLMKRLMLAHAFMTVDDVWLHIDPSNIRSQKATAKLGAKRVSEGPLTLGGKTNIWQEWHLARADWEKVCAARKG